jgi:hypothetical protein
MEATAKGIGEYLEVQARIGTPITYGQIVKRFPGLPPLGTALEESSALLNIRRSRQGRPRQWPSLPDRPRVRGGYNKTRPRIF